MPNVRFETKVRSVDLLITINNISEETANRIREYIAEEIHRDEPFAGILVAEKDAEKTAVVLNGRTLTRRQKIIRGMAAWNAVQRILTDATVHQDGYEWRRASAEEFCEEWRGVKGLEDVRGVGSVLSGIADEGDLRKWDRDAQHRKRTYRLPFPVVRPESKTAETVADNTEKSNTVADRLCEYRERSGLGIDEVSDLIGFPESVVKAWEAGTHVPSREGKVQLETLFGKHIFDGIQKPVIW